MDDGVWIEIPDLAEVVKKRKQSVAVGHGGDGLQFTMTVVGVWLGLVSRYPAPGHFEAGPSNAPRASIRFYSHLTMAVAIAT